MNGLSLLRFAALVVVCALVDAVSHYPWWAELGFFALLSAALTAGLVDRHRTNGDGAYEASAAEAPVVHPYVTPSGAREPHAS